MCFLYEQYKMIRLHMQHVSKPASRDPQGWTVLVVLMSVHSQDEHTSCDMRIQDTLRLVQYAAQGAI